MTRVLATVGPSLGSEKEIEEFYKLGVRTFRINLGKRKRPNVDYYNNLKKCKQRHNDIRILIDLPTDRPRVSCLTNNIKCNSGDYAIFLDASNQLDTCSVIPLLHFNKYYNEIKKSTSIFMDDGKTEFDIQLCDDFTKRLTCVCKKSLVEIKSDTSVVFNGVNIKFDLVTEEDQFFLDSIDQGIDYLSISFVQNQADVKFVRDWFEKRYGTVKIISKIEKKSALKNIDEIIEVSDGIIVARGDLLQNINPIELPKIQKMLVQKAHEYNCISIVATQMFETFASKGYYKCSELCDVSQAASQNVDYIMLSGESASSKYAKEVVKSIIQIISNEKKSYIKLNPNYINHFLGGK